MNVAVMSAFRNSAGFHIHRYFVRMARFQDALAREGHTLHLKLVWGDSDDGTQTELFNCASALNPATFELIERSHGGPVYGSTEEMARLRALSMVANGAFESIGPEIDVAIWIESDLLWDAQTFLRLIKRLSVEDVDVVAPLVFAGEAFYDIWGFRDRTDERYGPFFPFNKELQHVGPVLTEVNSVGSCLVMRGEVARECRIRNDYALVGFCLDARAHNFHVWVDPHERIHHP
jgi:hypothetical protein